MGKRDKRPAVVSTQPKRGVFDSSTLSRCSDLIATAKTDRRAAEVLHASQLYPQAVFALQQAVEKTIKAISDCPLV